MFLVRIECRNEEEERTNKYKIQHGKYNKMQKIKNPIYATDTK